MIKQPDIDALPDNACEDFGPLLADGALDLIRIPGYSSETYHVEMAHGQRFRFALAANGVVDVRIFADIEGADSSPASHPAFVDVDLFNFTFRAPRSGSFAVAVVNRGEAPVDVAVFFRTVSRRAHCRARSRSAKATA